MTAVATATMRGEVVDIRSLPGWKTAPRVWRTTGPDMRVRVICPDWLQRQQEEYAELARLNDEACQAADRKRAEWMCLISEIAERHQLLPGMLFTAGKLNGAITAARYECFAALRARGERVGKIAKFFRLDHSSVSYGIKTYLGRMREKEA